MGSDTYLKIGKIYASGDGSEEYLFIVIEDVIEDHKTTMVEPS